MVKALQSPVKAQTREKMAYLQLHEVSKVLSTPYPAATRDRALLETLARTGMRASEVVGLQKRDVNFTDLTFHVRAGKGNKPRLVPMSPNLVLLLQEVVKGLGDEDRVFTLNRQALHGLVRKYGQRAGLQRAIYPHMFRHSFAVAFLKGGGDIRTLQRILGHSRMDTTAVYLQLTDKDVADALKKVSLGF